MNRMEKNKKLRDELRQSEQHANRFARKTRNRHEEQAHHFEEDTHRNVENSYENQQQIYQKQPQHHHEHHQNVHSTKKLPKKHHPFRKLFVLLLLVVLGAGAYSVYGYQKRVQ